MQTTPTVIKNDNRATVGGLYFFTAGIFFFEEAKSVCFMLTGVKE